MKRSNCAVFCVCVRARARDPRALLRCSRRRNDINFTRYDLKLPVGWHDDAAETKILLLRCRFLPSHVHCALKNDDMMAGLLSTVCELNENRCVVCYAEGI